MNFHGRDGEGRTRRYGMGTVEFASETMTTTDGKICSSTDYGKNRLYHNDHRRIHGGGRERGVADQESLRVRLCVIDFQPRGHLDYSFAKLCGF